MLSFNANETNTLFPYVLYNDIEIDMLLRTYGATPSIIAKHTSIKTDSRKISYNFNKGD